MGTGASEDNLEPASCPRQAIVKPCIRLNESSTNEYVETNIGQGKVLTTEDRDMLEHKNVAAVKLCLHFTESSSTDDNDYAHAQIVHK